jgi:hypothetical protein
MAKLSANGRTEIIRFSVIFRTPNHEDQSATERTYAVMSDRNILEKVKIHYNEAGIKARFGKKFLTWGWKKTGRKIKDVNLAESWKNSTLAKMKQAGYEEVL